MTVYGIIADVHGNLEALEAVLGELDRQPVDVIVSLGDVVGYNADSDACARILSDRGIRSVAGNHDLIALGRLGFEQCAPSPALSLARTRQTLGDDTRAFLAGLPRSSTVEGGRVVLIHGSPGDVSEYMTAPEQFRAARRGLAVVQPAARVVLFGHTHVPRVMLVPGGGPPVERVIPAVREVALDGGDGVLAFVNPGSVNASRRARKLAEYAVFDAGANTVRFNEVPYDHRAVERKAAAGGYRMSRAQRLGRRIRRTAARLRPRVT